MDHSLYLVGRDGKLPSLRMRRRAECCRQVTGNEAASNTYRIGAGSETNTPSSSLQVLKLP